MMSAEGHRSQIKDMVDKIFPREAGDAGLIHSEH